MGQQININGDIYTIIGFGSLILDRPLVRDYSKGTIITVESEPIKRFQSR